MSEFPSKNHLTRLDLVGKSPSPEFLQDEESASICPLLTPNSASPSEADPLTVSLERKMLLEGKSPSPDFNQDEETALLAPSPVSTTYTVDPLRLAYKGSIEANDSEGNVSEGNQGNAVNASGDAASSSSSSFALQETNADFLNTHLYQQFNKDKANDVTTFITQETCSRQTDGFDAAGRKGPPDYCFLSWNWPIIRKSCFWSVMSLVVACTCVVIGMIASLPRRCYPEHTWYQGTVFYEIFPASFQDSDHDGIGDLRGIASRAEYLARLGVSAIRLNSIFQANHYPEVFDKVTNLTAIEKLLGTLKDFDYLRTVMHSKNISVVLDLPIYPTVKDLGEIKNVRRMERSKKNETKPETEYLIEGDRLLRPYIDGGIAGLMKYTSEHLKALSQTAIVEAIYFWFDAGVDGLYIKGLERFASDSRFLMELKRWKEIKESYRSVGKEKMLMCDYKVLHAIEDAETVDAILTTMDLLDVHLDLTNGTMHIKNEVNKYRESSLYDKKDYSWLHWNIGDVSSRRLSTRVENNIGAILFALLLPGTVSFFYGDEIGLQEIPDPHSDHHDIKHVHQLAPMRWGANGTGFTRSDILPWLPFAKAYKSTETLQTIFRNVTSLRRDSPSIYMSSVWKENENLSNHAFRYIDQNLIVLERSYPRRKSFAVIFNIGGTDVRRDLSTIYYGGELVQDVRGSSGVYKTFADLRLGAGESSIFKLDT